MRPRHIYFPMVCIVIISACNNPKDFWTTDPPERPAHEDPYTSDPVDPALKFAREASLINLTEIEMARAARKRTENEKVKRLAVSIERDHKEAQKKLKEIARQNGWDLPEGPSTEDSAEIASLDNIPDSGFDKEYIRMALERHQRAINKFELLTSAESGKKDTDTSGNNNVQHYDVDQQKASSLDPGVVTGTTPSSDIRNWAIRTLPNLREHVRLGHIILSDIP